MRLCLLLTLVVATLAGCGFHLRGSVSLPESMTRTYLDVPLSSPLRYELESLLLSAGGEVADGKMGATAILQVQSATISSRPLSLDALGRASEYALTLNVKYLLLSPQGEALSDKLTSRVERDFRYDQERATGAERGIVEREMYRVAAEQVVRRLRSVSRPAASGPAPAQ